MTKKYVYLFQEGDANMRELLGGKGANLAEMSKLGMPVPNGFTITTEACNKYHEDGETINEEIQAQIMEYLGKLEEETGKKIRGCTKSFVSIGSFRSQSQYAWYDGYNFESGY
jgi:pyruvate,orthophosphate dikinase